MKRYILVLLITFLGCTSNVKLTPIAEQLGKPRDDKAVLVTYRLNGNPQFFSVDNIIEGQSLGKLKRSEFSWHYFSPGTYTLQTTWSQAALIPSTERELILEAGKYYLLEMHGSVRVTTSLESRDFKSSTTSLRIGNYEEAVAWLDDCCHLVLPTSNNEKHP